MTEKTLGIIIIVIVFAFGIQVWFNFKLDESRGGLLLWFNWNGGRKFIKIY